MKKWMLVLFFVGFLMSACVVGDSGRSGFSVGASAQTYKRKHTHTIIVTPPASGLYYYNKGRGHGRKIIN